MLNFAVYIYHKMLYFYNIYMYTTIIKKSNIT